jgi:hypothetical protein
MSDENKPLTREELLAFIRKEFSPEFLDSFGAALRTVMLEVREGEQEECAKICDAHKQSKIAEKIRSRSKLFGAKTK